MGAEEGGEEERKVIQGFCFRQLEGWKANTELKRVEEERICGEEK